MAPPGSAQPTPGDMPRRAPVLPPPPHRPYVPSKFHVAEDYPRRGLAGVLPYTDTGVLLFVGTDPALIARLRSHYGGRLKIVKAVEREIRGTASQRPPDNAAPEDHARFAAADRCVRELFHAVGGIATEVVDYADLPAVAEIVKELERLAPTGPSGKHGGEAELIVLVKKSLTTQPDCPHVVLTNDGGASVVAHLHGLVARHSADLLAEFACSDDDMTADNCWTAWQNGKDVSRLPAHCRPSDRSAFVCSRSASGTCRTCGTPGTSSGGAALSR